MPQRGGWARSRIYATASLFKLGQRWIEAATLHAAWFMSRPASCTHPWATTEARIRTVTVTHLGLESSFPTSLLGKAQCVVLIGNSFPPFPPQQLQLNSSAALAW